MGLSVALLLIAGLVAMVWLGRRRSRRRQPALPAEFDPDDLAELSAKFSSIAAEYHAGHAEHTEAALRLRLQPVISRRSPVRTIRAAPVRGATRICFADGTSVLVRAQEGRLALLAYEAGRYPVCLRSCRMSPEGPQLTFECVTGQVTAIVVGLDQAD
ncbi:MAG: hypothetical protein Q4F67_07280 [Propionibacteriaceae bacterium]|nr:hypothetical protein [Propionibacteriaceae bacterium]